MTASPPALSPSVLAELVAERTARNFIQVCRPLADGLTEAAIAAMADLDCDTAAGDSYDPEDYREKAAAATAGVIEFLAWSDGPASRLLAAAESVEKCQPLIAMWRETAATILERDPINATALAFIEAANQLTETLGLPNAQPPEGATP